MVTSPNRTGKGIQLDDKKEELSEVLQTYVCAVGVSEKGAIKAVKALIK
jgi:hypothetical protein